MAKALGVAATPKMIELARTLDSDHKSFRELEWQNQVILAESQLNLDGLATDEELREYEIEKMLRESENPLEKAKAKILMEVNNVR